MEEETGVKVTRLRRRLSVEADDVKSPSTQSTPTKKRGGRLVAKPQLELIDENATEINKPKRTRKSVARDAEPDEKTVTPSRRSTRIRSNTSLVSEIPIEAEDKGTPAKRNTRIKSNTSIVSETAQHVDSPRARRAARRTSLVVSGSDNEASATPVRSTRRTRKESTSSIDKQAELNPDKLEAQIKEVITEEPENPIKDSADSLLSKTPSPKETNQSFTTRKSPRLKEKICTSSSPDNNERDDSALVKEVRHEKSNSVEAANQSSPKVGSKIPVEINLSVSTSNLIKQLGTQPKKDHSNLNKTTSAVETAQSKSKRNRTKSWSAVSSNPANDNNFLSDTEVIGRKKKGDNAVNRNNKTIRKSKEQTENTDTLYNKEEKKCNDKSLPENVNTSTELDKSATKDKRLPKNIPKIEAPEKEDLNFTEKFFGKAPKGIVQSSVYIEDSDSNAGSTLQNNLLKGTANEDQCVPVVEHQFEYQISNETENNLSCEPMDIDETMPENVSLLHYLDKSDQSGKNTGQQKRKSFTSISANDSINVTDNKSHRKSSVSNLENDNEIISNTSNNQEVITAASTDNPADNHIKECKRKSSLSALDVTDEAEANSRKSESNVNGSLNKSIRKSSISTSVAEDDKCTNSLNSSSKNRINKSDLSEKGVNNVNDSSNRTRKGLTASPNKSTRNSLGIVTNENEVDSLVDNDPKNVSLNKSKRKSSISKTSDDNIDHNSSKSKEEITGFEKNSDKSKRKSYNSKLDLENSTSFVPNRSSNKSKRKSSISDMGSQIFDKSNNENKSTLVLSQIKDVSEDGVLKEAHELNESKNSNEQLSKSVTMPNRSKNKESDKKNLSLTYSTSTPLQQKPFKKLGIQINSSMITPNSTTKCENKRSSRKSSILSKTDASDFSDEEEREESAEENEEEFSEEESMNKSKLIDNEADEASENYESGDSREEDSVEYEEQHEIVEKGETLDSEDDDFSDDSEYEKGSFIVDSAEEDAALLSGSGDDLSMSTDELNMSKKSKKKFNDRQAKEQKKASREMFAARHKVNESDIKGKRNKKVNRQQTKSSESESDGEVGTLQKKNKRRRIDSSQDITLTESDHDVTLFKQKKVKKLSDSVCEENEKEISIHDNIETTKDEDPLSLHNIVKEEPMTPQQDQNIPKIKNIEKIQEIDVDNTNLSILQTNQTTDPLETSSIQDDAMNDTSEESISENEEITQNYESVLNNLNNKSNKIKSVDISLNLSKKNKQQIKESIVDELNLTHPKKSKKGKQRNDKEKSTNIESTKKANKSINIQEEGSSDSIDMKLLFNDDSTDNELKASTENKTVLEEFIPLKRTEGKTNILRSTEVTSGGQNESVQHVSSAKKLKHKASDLEQTVVDDTDDGGVNFFIDTTGTHTEMNNTVNNTSIKSSAKKNKQKHNKFSSNIENNKNDDDSSDTPLEISYHSEKNNKSQQDLNVSQTSQEKAVTISSKTPTSAKKNKERVDKNLTIVQHSDNDSSDSPPEISYPSDKNKQNLDVSQTSQKEAVAIGSKTPTSAKKNKKSIDKNLAIVQHSDDDSSDHPQEISYHSDKSNKSKQDLNISQTGQTKPAIIDGRTPTSGKKNKKSIDKNLTIVQHSDDDSSDHPQYNDKNNKSKQDWNVSQSGQTKPAIIGGKTPKSGKKNKKGVDNTLTIVQHSDDDSSDHPQYNDKNNKSKQDLNVSQNGQTKTAIIGGKTPKSGKKNKKSVDNTLTIVQHSEIEAVAVVVEESSSKKQKRKLSANKSIEKEKDDGITVDELTAHNESSMTMNPKKKRKVSHTIDTENIESKEKQEEEQSAIKKPKKKKTTPNSNPMDGLPKKSKKRKERDDDDGEILSKVIKQNSFDKVHVPRLPTNVLNQLDVKPKKHEKEIISTTSFTVEGIRQKRNKPSNYLEQSVYLNDSVEDTTNKIKVKTPKVLPFIPTASTSDYGFTTHFTVNVLPQEIKFVAQSSDVSNFKNDRLQKNRIQKLGTFEKYKRHRNIKISKF